MDWWFYYSSSKKKKYGIKYQNFSLVGFMHGFMVLRCVQEKKTVIRDANSFYSSILSAYQYFDDIIINLVTLSMV